MQELPSSSDNISRWCHDLFRHKDVLLQGYYEQAVDKKKRFEAKAAGWAFTEEATRIAMRMSILPVLAVVAAGAFTLGTAMVVLMRVSADSCGLFGLLILMTTIVLVVCIHLVMAAADATRSKASSY
eukprot:scaffold1603_cov415-Prasinococcus_capsulatus_cf.AAC.11